MPTSYMFPINHLEHIAQDTVELGLDSSSGAMPFTPGQYIRLTLPAIQTNNPTDSYREFSIASPPSASVMTTAFRVSDSPFKKLLLSLVPGTVIQTEGPLGVFTLPETDQRPIVMIAGGVGITPFMSMLRDERYKDYDINLQYFNSSPERAAYSSELAELASHYHRDIQMIYEALTPASLKTGASGARYYIAGPPGMVDAARQTLAASGIMMSDIITEEFTGY